MGGMQFRCWRGTEGEARPGERTAKGKPTRPGGARRLSGASVHGEGRGHCRAWWRDPGQTRAADPGGRECRERRGAEMVNRRAARAAVFMVAQAP
eukprot:6772568-Prymnesium_polylepis.2